jgi:starch synthase
METSGTVLQIAPVLPVDARQQAFALAQAGLLRRLVTTWVPSRERPWPVWASPFLQPLARRRPSPVIGKYLHRVLMGDLIDRITRWSGGSPIDAIDRRFAAVDRAAARRAHAPTRIVVAREDGCLRAFRRARMEGILCVYDLPTAHYKTVCQLLQREMDLFPGVCTVSLDQRDFAADRTARKDAELALADQILCPSNFVRQSLLAAGVSAEEIHVLPFAAEPQWLARDGRSREPMFLYVGQISLRKGVHRLLLAWKQLKAYRTHRLRLVGTMHLSPKFTRDFSGLYEYIPPIPRNQLPIQYMQAQALLLNSLAEGFAMVIPEAMSCGTAVLVSRNSGAEGFVADGREGRLFPFDDDEALKAVLDWALSHPTELAEMGRRARLKAAEWTWPDYRRAFAGWIQSVQDKTRRGAGSVRKDHNGSAVG